MGKRIFDVNVMINDGSITVELCDTETGEIKRKTRGFAWLGRRFFDREVEVWKKIDIIEFANKPKRHDQ
jgi:hypothetical protein